MKIETVVQGKLLQGNLHLKIRYLIQYFSYVIFTHYLYKCRGCTVRTTYLMMHFILNAFLKESFSAYSSRPPEPKLVEFFEISLSNFEL